MGGPILLGQGGKVFYFRAGMVEGFTPDAGVQITTIPMMIPDPNGGGTAVVGGVAKIVVPGLWVTKDQKIADFQCVGSAQWYETQKPEWWETRCK